MADSGQSEALAAPQQARPRGRPVTQPCGTRAAHRRHKAHGETPCLPCVEADRQWEAARRLAKGHRPRPRRECGTEAGYRWHRRQVCPACLVEILACPILACCQSRPCQIHRRECQECQACQEAREACQACLDAHRDYKHAREARLAAAEAALREETPSD